MPQNIADNPKMVRVDLEKEPPKDVLNKTFSLDPSINIGENAPMTVEIADKDGSTIGSVKTEKVVLDQKDGSLDPLQVDNGKEIDSGKIDDGKEKEKKESILKPPVDVKKTDNEKGKEKKEVIKQISLPVNKNKVVRSYEGYSPTEVAAFKQMSDDSYMFTSNLIKENKELAKLKDSSFLQHPQAYTLSPEYQEAQREVNYAIREGQHWQQQLELIKVGKPFKALTEWDNNGNPVLSNEIEPTDALEENVRLAMSKCFSVAEVAQNKLRQLPQQFKGKVDSDLQAINNERQQRFAWVADPKLLDYTINIEGMGDLSLKQIKEDFRNLFPPYLRNNPGVEVASDLFIALRIQSAELAQAKSGQQTAEIKRSEAERAEPGSSDRPIIEQKPEFGKVREFSLSGLPTN